MVSTLVRWAMAGYDRAIIPAATDVEGSVDDVDARAGCPPGDRRRVDARRLVRLGRGRRQPLGWARRRDPRVPAREWPRLCRLPALRGRPGGWRRRGEARGDDAHRGRTDPYPAPSATRAAPDCCGSAATPLHHRGIGNLGRSQPGPHRATARCDPQARVRGQAGAAGSERRAGKCAARTNPG